MRRLPEVASSGPDCRQALTRGEGRGIQSEGHDQSYGGGMRTRGGRTRAANRRKRRLGRVTNDLTAAEWGALVAAWGGCAYCGPTDRPLQRDCVLPISRGGRYTVENVVPACGSCNASKCNDEVTGWLRRRRLDERTFLVRHLEIRAQLQAGPAG